MQNSLIHSLPKKINQARTDNFLSRNSAKYITIKLQYLKTFVQKLYLVYTQSFILEKEVNDMEISVQVVDYS